MLSDTRGIVLQHFKYSESSIIARIFTEEFGLQSYIVKGIRSKRSKARLALFQPLTLLNLVVYHKETQSLHHIKESNVSFAYQHIPNDIIKMSILLFLNEVLIKAVKVETPDKALFGWLYDALTWLDLSDKNVNNYHLLMMVQLSRFFGFYPKISTPGKATAFDLQEGLFTDSLPHHPYYVTDHVLENLERLLFCSFEDIESLSMTTTERRKLLDALVSYYRLHIPGYGEMKSLEVLKTVLD